MAADTTIHPFPDLRALAEEEARESYSAMREAGIATPYDVHGRKRSEADPWDQLPAGTRDWWISARMALLCDLTRFGSRAVVAAMVAQRVGLSGWDSAGVHLGRQGRTWAMWDGRNASVVFTEDMRGGSNRLDRDTRVVVRGISSVTDPAVALALIVRHLWPESP